MENAYKLTVEIKSIDAEQTEESDPDSYLKEVTEYLPSEDTEMSYDQYLDTVIPKTRILFDLVKNNINGKFITCYIGIT